MSIKSRALATAVSLGALLLAVTPALADTELSHWGKVGQRSLNDSSGNYGATCNYTPHPSDFLAGVTVRGPNVYARDTTPAVDSGKVGWRFLVKRHLGSSATWTTVYKSPVWKATTLDNSPAFFSDRNVSLTIPDDANSHGYQIWVKTFWYSASGRKIGAATRRIDWYAEVGDPGTYPLTECYAHFI